MINEETLDKTARLSSLKLMPEQKLKLIKEMSSIIDHFAALEAVDTDGVEPLHTPVKMENLWRPDDVELPVSVERILENLNDLQEGQIKVPQVVK